MAQFLFDDCGGMLPGQKLKCIVPGGISTKVLTAAEVEPLTFDHQSFAGGRFVAGVGRDDRHRGGHVHGAPAPGDAALLPP